MVAWQFSVLSALLLRTLTVFAQEAVLEPIDDEATDPKTSSPLAVTVSASFPQTEIFGVKLVNGHATQAVLSIANSEPAPVQVAFVGGSLATLADPPQLVRNLTTQRYSIEIPAGEQETVTYSFSTELHPQDLRLQIVSIIKDEKSGFHTFTAYNSTVSVVEAPTSLFDPQIIFLYLILAGIFVGTCYFIYTTWITTLFPQKRRPEGTPRSKSGAGRPKKSIESPDKAGAGDDASAVASGAKAYDESWIPPQHLSRPEAKRVRSGTPKTKTRT